MSNINDKYGINKVLTDLGITEINSTLKNFNFNAKIKGSKQQELLEEYIAIMTKFNNQNLDLIKDLPFPDLSILTSNALILTRVLVVLTNIFALFLYCVAFIKHKSVTINGFDLTSL